MAKLTLNDISSGFQSNTAVNTNNTLIEAALENTLSRDGTSPNQMAANIDMNTYSVINLGAPANATAAARLQDISDSDATGAASAALRAELLLASETTGGKIVGYFPEGTGALSSTVQDKLRESVSVLDFGAIGDGTTNCFASMLSAWTHCLAEGKNLYIPNGTYVITSENSFPFGRIDGSPVTSLLDCKNITIFGEGPATILKTSSIGGADVFQFNGAKNLHVRNLKLMATISGTSAGSNGISITGGWDNITIDNVWCENLASLDKTTYVDGGKALTIQPPSSGTVLCGTIAAKIFAKGCAEGFGYEPDLDHIASQPVCIHVDLIAEDCYQAVKISAAESTGALSVGMESGVRVVATAINCQTDLVLARAHGGKFDVKVVTTKTSAARLLNPNAIQWFAANSDLVATIITYAKNTEVYVSGDKGTCTYKAKIGGASDASSGLGGTTQYCSIYLDLAGTAATANLLAVDSGGNIMSSSKLVTTLNTSSTIPSDFHAVSRKNVLEVIGEYGQAILPGNIRFPSVQVASSDGNTLDDYKEGVFVPYLSDSSLASEGATYSIQSGFYTKVGNLIYFTLTIVLTGLGTLTVGEPAFIIGLPYSNRTASGNTSVFSIRQAVGLNLSAGDIIGASIGSGDQYISLKKWTGASTTGDSNLTVGEISATGGFIISGMYLV